MSESFILGNPEKKRLTPSERVKFGILGNRLRMTMEEASELLEDLHKEATRVFAIPDSAIVPDVDFSGRDFDIVFTINKQNTPKNKV